MEKEDMYTYDMKDWPTIIPTILIESTTCPCLVTTKEHHRWEWISTQSTSQRTLGSFEPSTNNSMVSFNLLTSPSQYPFTNKITSFNPPDLH